MCLLLKKTEQANKQNKKLIATENRLVVLRQTGIWGGQKDEEGQLFGDRWELHFCGGHFAVYVNIEWLCCAPEANILLVSVLCQLTK